MENKTVNMSKLDLFNAKNNSRSIKDFIGEKLIVSGAAIVKNGAKSQSGEPCDVGYIATTEGVIGFTSNVCLAGMPDFCDLLDETMSDGGAIAVTFFEGKTNSGKPYFNFTATMV